MWRSSTDGESVDAHGLAIARTTTSASVACRICGSSDTSRWLTRGDWHYRSCASCSAVWLDPLPDAAWAREFYDSGYFSGGGKGGYQSYLADESQHRSNARDRVAVACCMRPSARGGWLDVGCAVGYTLDEARRAGYAPLGVELSDWARNIARDRYNLDVMSSLAEVRRLRPRPVGVVSFFQVLEHMRDPVEALRDVRSILSPGGLLLIETWDRGSTMARLCGRYWQQITPPSVLWLFDRKSLAHLFDRTGFRLISMRRSAKRVGLGWALGQVADKSPSAIRHVLRSLAASVLGRLSFRYGLGDLITVVATADDLTPDSPTNDERTNLRPTRGDRSCPPA